MTTNHCPQCGEPNEQNAIRCTACGARLDGDRSRDPESAPGSLLKENVSNLLGLVAGAALVLLGIFVPAIGSAILQLVLLFTESSRAVSDAQPNDSDGWIVIAVGVLFILVSGFGLYASLKQFWAKRLDPPEPKE